MNELEGRLGTVRGVSGPQVARIARILREDLPGLVRFQRAAVFVAGPTGRPRLIASAGRDDDARSGSAEVAAVEAPDRLRAALQGRLGVVAPYRVADREGEALVLPFATPGEGWRGALVLFSPTHRWSREDLGRAVGTVRLVERALASG